MSEQEVAFSPSQVCEIFDLKRSTLFRWEKDGKIPPVPRKSDLAHSRLYGQEHMEWLYLIVNLDIENQLITAEKAGNELEMAILRERRSIVEFIVGDRETATEDLLDLVSTHPLSDRAERILTDEMKRGRGVRQAATIFLQSDSTYVEMFG